MEDKEKVSKKCNVTENMSMDPVEGWHGNSQSIPYLKKKKEIIPFIYTFGEWWNVLYKWLIT